MHKESVFIIVVPTSLQAESNLASKGCKYVSSLQESVISELRDDFRLKETEFKVILPHGADTDYFRNSLSLSNEEISITLDRFYELGEAKYLLVSQYYPLESHAIKTCISNPQGTLKGTEDLEELYSLKLQQAKDRLDSLPSTSLIKLEYSEELFYLYENLPFHIAEPDSIEFEVLVKHGTALLLTANVVLDSIIHFNIDPSEGWIEKINLKNGNKLVVSSPFIYSIFDIYPDLFYTPRKLKLTHGTENFNLKFRKKNSNWLDFPPSVSNPKIVESTILRDTPNLYGLKISEKCENFIKHSSIYIKAGIGGFEKESTSGITSDLWLEDQDGSIKTDTEVAILVSLNFPSTEILSMRTLGSIGSVSEELIKLESFGLSKIDGQDASGNLMGLRIIDGLSHFICDIRLSKSLDTVEIHSTKKITSTKLLIYFIFPHKSIPSSENIASLHFSIY